MKDDAAYLRHYAATGDETAFAALVQRCLPLVYAAALRRLAGDTHRAEDVAQQVFTALARNARALAQHPDLAGWLFTTTRFLAAKAVRDERRRLSRELAVGSDVHAMNDEPPAAPPAALHGVLDDALMELRQLDRQVILLRFHRGLRLAEIGAALGATENAAQKRLDRALERLRDKLARRGITSSAAALAVAFEQQGAVAMPAGLAAAATSAGLACAVGAAGAGGLFAVSGLVTLSKLQLGAAAALVAGAATGWVWQGSANAALRTEIVTHTETTRAVTAQLQTELDALTQRAAAAEADAAKLQQAIATARPASPPPTAARPRVLTDLQQQADAALQRAGRLARDKKYQEALDEYLKTYREVAGPRGTVHQQRIMTALEGLGTDYPPAIAALRQLRDAGLQKYQAGATGNTARDLISEVALLNERLGDGRASLALYDLLPPGDPGRQSIGLVAHKSFVEARRYADALVGKSFGSMVNELEMTLRSPALKAGRVTDGYRAQIAHDTLSNIEVLAGAGKPEEARVLADKLLAFDNSEATRAALQRHLDRAAGRSVSP